MVASVFWQRLRDKFLLDSLGLLPSVAINCTFAIGTFLMCFILWNLDVFGRPVSKLFRAQEGYLVFWCVTQKKLHFGRTGLRCALFSLCSCLLHFSSGVIKGGCLKVEELQYHVTALPVRLMAEWRFKVFCRPCFKFSLSNFSSAPLNQDHPILTRPTTHGIADMRALSLAKWPIYELCLLVIHEFLTKVSQVQV